MYGVMASEKCCSGKRTLALTPFNVVLYVLLGGGGEPQLAKRVLVWAICSWALKSADNTFGILAKRDFLKKPVTPHMIGSYEGVFFVRDLENALLAAIILLNKPLIRKQLMAIRHFQGY